MRLADIDDDDAVFDASRDHANTDGSGYCCPHCLQDNGNRHPSTGERTAVICDHCGATFVVWDEIEIRQCSGKLVDGTYDH